MPEDTGYDGQWVWEFKTFLFRTDPARTPDTMVGLICPNGEEAEGFDAAMVAGLLDISVDALLDINRRKLLLIAVEPIPTKSGAVASARVTIQTPDNGISFDMGKAHPGGKA